MDTEDLLGYSFSFLCLLLGVIGLIHDRYEDKKEAEEATKKQKPDKDQMPDHSLEATPMSPLDK